MKTIALGSHKGNDGQNKLADFETYRQQINTEDTSSDEPKSDDGKPSWNVGSNDHEDDENVDRCPECSSLSERRENGVSQR